MHAPASQSDNELAQLDLNRLRWRARRGMLENDLIMQRFFDQHGSLLQQPEMRHAFTQLLALSDNDLLDLLMGKCHPETVELPRSEAMLILLNALQQNEALFPHSASVSDPSLRFPTSQC